MSAARVQGSVYAIVGAAVGCMVLMFTIVAFAYGAPLHPLVYVVGGSSLALIFAGVASFSHAQRGRIIALLALVALGTIIPPLITQLVPQHNIIISPLDGAVLIAYLTVLAFGLFYPVRLKFSIPAFLAACFGLAVFAGITYRERLRSGEYARPAYACFRWHPTPTDDLVIARDPFGLISHEVRLALSGAGIAGTLEWTGGSWHDISAASRLLVLAQSKPDGEIKLCPAKTGLLIYAFDGTRWITYPAGSATHSLCLTLETQGSRTMIYQPVGGSKQGSQAFSW